jgi:hypothetical protein
MQCIKGEKAQIQTKERQYSKIRDGEGGRAQGNQAQLIM